MSNLIKNQKLYKVFSKHPYYQYLGKYDGEFLRRIQTDRYQKLGRGAQYYTLTKYYSNTHLSLEEEHSDEHRTPLWYLNIVYPAIVWATSIVIIANLFFLGDAGKIFNQKTWDMSNREPTDLEGTPTRYEFVYQLRREQRW